MAERFAKVNEQQKEGSCLTTQHQNTVFVYIIKQLYHSLSPYMNSYTTRAHGITVKYDGECDAANVVWNAIGKHRLAKAINCQNGKE